MNDQVEAGHHWEKNRVEAFSDGVLAIAITLLVLDIHIPKDLHLAQNLEHEWPAYLAYVTSFLTVGGVWVAHHLLFRALRSIDSTLIWLNMLLLLLTGFLPFPTGLVAEALRQPESTAEIAVFLYGLTVLAIELVLQAFVRYAVAHPELLDQRRSTAAITKRLAAGRWWWSSRSILFYVGAIGVGLVGFPKIATALYLALAIRSVTLIESHRRSSIS
jgi:uncharacterized membrane protein